jgi:nucleoid-associated protein YgaU
MGNDFRTGLMVGVVLAGAALIWVATRPSLGPHARIGPAVASAEGWSLRTGEIRQPSAPDRQAQSTRDRMPDAAIPDWLPVPPRLQEGENLGSEEDRDETGQEAQPLQLSQLPPPPPSSPAEGLPDLTIYEQSEPIKTTRFHIVRRGDSLSTIAREHYGSADKWRKILAANQQSIKDANKISPGTKLIIPD